MRVRRLAARLVHDILYKDKYSNMALESYMNSEDLSKEDRGFCTHLTRGTLQNSIYLEHLLKDYIKDFNRTDKMVLSVLKVSLYQYLFMDKVPSYAIVDQACNVTKAMGKKGAVPFVNAVLRNFLRNFKGHPENLPAYIRYSCTKEAYKAMRTLLSEDETIDILKKFNGPSETFISINTHFHKKENLLTQLEEEGFSLYETEDESIIIKGPLSPFSSDNFKKGAFVIQDEKAAKIAKILEVKKGHNVLDACAAPGGKTIYLANQMENQGQILATDLWEARVSLTRENIDRCGFTNVLTKTQDMTFFEEEYFEAFDRILMDVPCSGLGVAGKRPEIKLKYTDSVELIKTQRAIIRNCSKYLKPGASMVYGTCTINKAENQDIVNEFLSENRNFYLDYEFFEQGFYGARIIKKS